MTHRACSFGHERRSKDCTSLGQSGLQSDQRTVNCNTSSYSAESHNRSSSFADSRAGMIAEFQFSLGPRPGAVQRDRVGCRTDGKFAVARPATDARAGRLHLGTRNHASRRPQRSTGEVPTGTLWDYSERGRRVFWMLVAGTLKSLHHFMPAGDCPERSGATPKEARRGLSSFPRAEAPYVVMSGVWFALPCRNGIFRFPEPPRPSAPEGLATLAAIHGIVS